MKPRLAIIGSGISGLGCAWLLRERFALTVYEQDAHAGGHTNTITVDEDGRAVPIDTGFMVFNHVTYPNLTRLFRELDVATTPTDMSFSVQHTPSGLEYNGGSLDLLFAQRRNLLRPRHWRMLMAINRFNSEAVAALTDSRWEGATLREYVDARGYGEDMLQLYLLPMSSAVWSTPPGQMEAFPALTLLRFWHNHGFLGLSTQHPWWTVCGGAQQYVRKIRQAIGDCVRTGCAAVRVERHADHVTVHAADGSAGQFDRVIMAAHAPQSLALLDAPDAMESRLLGAFAYQENTATLHTDPQFMPRTRRAWAAWNYRLDEGPSGAVQPTTHYWMNRLQKVSETRDYFVSLNCADRVPPDRVLRQIRYEHPVFDLPAVRAQAELPALNTPEPGRRTFYAGAWFRYGFHEDGFTSAIGCCRALTGEEVWP